MHVPNHVWYLPGYEHFLRWRLLWVGSYLSRSQQHPVSCFICMRFALIVRCCIKKPCSSGGVTGHCMNTADSCNGHFDPANLCPGDQSIQCCLPNSGGGGGSQKASIVSHAAAQIGKLYSWDAGDNNGATTGCCKWWSCLPSTADCIRLRWIQRLQPSRLWLLWSYKVRGLPSDWNLLASLYRLAVYASQLQKDSARFGLHRWLALLEISW